MGEELDVWALSDDSHAECFEVADLALFDQGGSRAEDGAVQMLRGGDVCGEFVDVGEGVVRGVEAGYDAVLGLGSGVYLVFGAFLGR